MTVAAYYAKHQVEGRAFIRGRAGCWFTHDKYAVVAAEGAYRYCTAGGYMVTIGAGVDVARFLAVARQRGSLHDRHVTL